MALGADQHLYHKDNFVVQACSSLIGKTALLFNSTLDKAGFCNVKNQQALGTMAHCIEQLPYKTSRSIFLESCAKYNLTEEQFMAAYENATDKLVVTKDDPNFKLKKIYYKPVKLTQKKVQGAWDSYIGRYGNFNYSHYYGWVLVSYWFLAVLIAGLCNLMYFIAPDVVQSLNGTVSNTFRKYLTLPGLFGKSHSHHKTYLHFLLVMIPTRLESILVAIWVAMCVIFCGISITHDSPNVFWASNAAEIGRKVSDRSGMLALYIMPNAILFAGRNNFLIWISGWQQSRFITIHKWSARMLTLTSIVHAIGMNISGKAIGKYEDRNSRPYVRWGYVAVVAGSIMCFQSLMYFRRNNYELFLFSHIVLAIVFVLGTWRHIIDENFEYFAYAFVAVWAFDRLVRLVRLATFGIRTASVQLVANETLRITVSRPSWWKPFPSCIAYIHFLRPTCFWQSHPFTIVDSVETANTLTIYAKVKGGVTHGLYQYLSNQPNMTADIKVCVEGAYGYRSALYKYQNATFLAGGNGVPGLYYEAVDIASRQSATRVRFYWIIRHYRSIEWFYPELLKMKDMNIEPVIYVTQPNVGLTEPIVDTVNSSEEEEEEQEKKSDLPIESNDYINKLKQKLDFIEFREGRPDISEIVANNIQEANGPIGFATCGHGSMVDDARKAVANSLDITKYRVELFEQMQGW